MKIFLIAAAFTAMTSAPLYAAEKEGMPVIQIQKNGSQPAITGDENYFTGKVSVTRPFKGAPPARISGATVSFEPGARTAWHTHPLGQTLVVTSGNGLIQEEGGLIDIIGEGDVVWIPPAVKHWHGASPDSGMTHIAISEALDGKVVAWLEKVTDEQYSSQ